MLVLASASPRRREILTQLGVGFSLEPSEVDEPPYEGGDPACYAGRLAAMKAGHVAARHGGSGRVVLGADTIVVKDGVVLGKPADDTSAMGMLTMLAGTVHDVFTAVSLRGEHVEHDFVERTRVWFRPLARESLERYVASGEGRDKAGSYGIQELGAGLVERIEGSYSNVVGLPAAQTLAALERVGVVKQWP